MKIHKKNIGFKKYQVIVMKFYKYENQGTFKRITRQRYNTTIITKGQDKKGKTWR